MVNLDVYEDNVELKTITPCVPTFDARDLSPIPTGSSDYNDLENKPSIEGATLEGNVTLEELGAFSGDYNDLINKPVLFDGDYNSLTNQPIIPTVPTNVSAFTNDAGYLTEYNEQQVLTISNDTISLTGGSFVKLPAAAVGFSGDYNDLTNKPNIPSRTSQLVNNSGFITADDIPPMVTDLGEIDGDQYEWDIEGFLNTLTETGSYIFLWDEFKYWVDIETLEADGVTKVQQIFWGTEDGPSTTAYRGIMVEDGEVVDQQTITYLTFQEATTAFSRNTHTHVRLVAQNQSVWDFCNTVAIQNAMPIVIYFDSTTNKTYLIETYVGYRQPLYKMQKVTEMNDTSYFCQRSSYYYSGAEHWRNWYKFTGEIFTPSR